jgi:hypothetical protein
MISLIFLTKIYQSLSKLWKGRIVLGGKEFAFGIASGEIFQLGIIVRDIEAAMKFYAENFKVGPFTLMRGFVAPAGSYRGGTENPTLSIAHGHTGKLFVELIQQHDAVPSVYTEYIDQYGFGVHHYGLAIAPEDYDRITGDYYTKGFENVFTDRLPSGARIRYIAPRESSMMEAMKASTGVSYLECVEVVPGEEEFFAGMRDKAIKWDGKTITL